MAKAKRKQNVDPKKFYYFSSGGGAQEGKGPAKTPDQIREYIYERSRFELLRAQLENERTSFESHWRQIAEYVRPARMRFWVTNVNRGERRNLKIIDGTGTLASRTLRSGMMSGVTSPARPWFKLSTGDDDLDENPAVKKWLYTVADRMSRAFAHSNLYNALPIVYGDMGDFGTAAMLVEQDFTGHVFDFTPLALGSYWIANDARLKVNVFHRKFRYSVRQVVEKFGTDPVTGERDWTNISAYVKGLWENGLRDAWVDIYHFIVPNDEYDPRRGEAKFKRYRSVYYEAGASSQTSLGGYTPTEPPTSMLRDSGYDYFPVLAPRWEVNAEDVYGTDCPGMTALSDILGLQVKAKRKAEAIEKLVRPPMKAPTSMRSVKSSILPGDTTYVDERDGKNGYTPVFTIDPRVAELVEDIQDNRKLIDRAYFADLFLMLTESDRRDITAREIDERHDEKLLALGPVLEQLNQDLLDPLIDIGFRMMAKQRRLPPPPQEMRGIQLRVEYISIMAEAQKLLGIEGIERFAHFATGILQVNPQSAAGIDFDDMLSQYGQKLSIPPTIIRSEEERNAILKQQQEMMAQRQQLENAQTGADTAQTLSNTDTGGDNALTQLLSQAEAGNVVPTR